MPSELESNVKSNEGFGAMGFFQSEQNVQLLVTSLVVSKHFRYLKWRYLPVEAVCTAYVRENPSPKWPYKV